MKRIFAILFTFVLIAAMTATLFLCSAPCSHRDADDDSLCDKCGEDYTDGKDIEDKKDSNDGNEPDDGNESDNGNEPDDGNESDDGNDTSAECSHRDADDDGKCDKCGEDFEDGLEESTAGLTFELNED